MKMHLLSKLHSVSNPLKRKLIQLAAFGFCNPHLQNFAHGSLYTGKWKTFCTPGLHCYSCPAATFSCPIGALQAISGSIKFNFSFYVTGLILAFGVIFGRVICGFLCPFGLFQEILHKIPSPKFTLPKPFKFIKYAVLVIFVLILPASSKLGMPAFCEFICPAGTLEGGLPMLFSHKELRLIIGNLFFLKMVILFIVVIGSIFIFRFFCKILCPLGTIYGLCNKISFCKLKVNSEKCVNCGECAKNCQMNVNPLKNPQSIECIRCGKCAYICPKNAIKINFSSLSFGKTNSTD